MIESDIELFKLTKQEGNFPVWVKDIDGNIFTGDSFDLCLTFAGGDESTRVFHCIDESGDSCQLFPEQIIDYDRL